VAVECCADAGVAGGEGDEEAERVWDLCSLDGCWWRLGAVCCWCIVGGRLERVGFLELISMAGKRGGKEELLVLPRTTKITLICIEFRGQFLKTNKTELF
jgi:hypothetical protein